MANAVHAMRNDFGVFVHATHGGHRGRNLSSFKEASRGGAATARPPRASRTRSPWRTSQARPCAGCSARTGTRSRTRRRLDRRGCRGPSTTTSGLCLCLKCVVVVCSLGIFEQRQARRERQEVRAAELKTSLRAATLDARHPQAVLQLDRRRRRHRDGPRRRRRARAVDADGGPLSKALCDQTHPSPPGLHKKIGQRESRRGR